MAHKINNAQLILGDPVEFGRKLLALRLNLKLSQKEIAARVGVTATAYTNWEKGTRMPYLNRLKSIADSLGVPISYFSNETKISDPLRINEELFKADINQNTIPLLNPADFEDKIDHNALYRDTERFNADIVLTENIKNYFAFKVRSSDMTGNNRFSIPKGAIAICTTKFALSQLKGCPCVLTIRKQPAIIREIDNFDDKEMVLKYWNPQYNDDIVPVNDVLVFGKVIRAIMSFTDL